jgi:hypothetical protein
LASFGSSYPVYLKKLFLGDLSVSEHFKGCVSMLAFCVTFQELCVGTYPNTQVFCYIMTLVNLDGVANFEI